MPDKREVPALRKLQLQSNMIIVLKGHRCKASSIKRAYSFHAFSRIITDSTFSDALMQHHTVQ